MLRTLFRGNVGIQAAISVIGTSANTLWMLFIPYYLNSFDLEANIGFIYSFAALFGALGYFIGGRFGDAYGRRKAIIIGDLICCLSPLLLLSKNLYLAIMGLPVVAFGLSFTEPNKSMLLVESAPQRLRGTLLMLATRVMPSIPPIILAPLGAYFYEAGLYSLSLTIGFIGFLLCVLLATLLRETLVFKKPASSKVKREIILEPSILLLIIVFTIPALSSKAIDWYVPLYLKERGLTVEFYGYMFAASSAAATIGSLISGIAVDFLNPYRVTALGLSFIAISLLLFSLPQPPFLYITLYSLMLFTRMVFVASPPVIIAERYSIEKRSTYMGLLGIGVMIAGVIGPSITSLALLTKYITPFLIFSMLNMIAILIIGIIKKHRGTSKD